MSNHSRFENRRQFLKLLAASPALPFLNLPADWMKRVSAQSPTAAAQSVSDVIASAKDGLDVFDFEAAAHAKVPVAHWGYLSSGTDDERSLRANREGFDRYAIRPRRLVDTSKTDMSVQIFGKKWETPILLCPVGGQKAYHPQGEIAVAKAAGSKHHLQVMSTVSSSSIEDVNTARGEPVWFQLYSRPDWGQTLSMIKRAEAAGCPAVVWTIDLLGGRNMETFARAQRADTRNCMVCHTDGNPGSTTNRPMMRQLPAAAGAPDFNNPTWDNIKRLKDATGMKVLVKGILTREDAELAVEHGVDGMFVSNHGGRADSNPMGTVERLPEIAAGVRGRVPIICDGGFRRGNDVFKALALGATAIGVGRPYIWGLGSFGQEGVEAVLDILRRELLVSMRQAGTTSVAKITKDYIFDRGARA